MKLSEKLKDAMKNLAETKNAVENGEKSAEDLSKAINGVKDIQAKMEAAKDADSILKSLGNDDPAPADPTAKKAEFKTIGEYVANELKKSGINLKKKGADYAVECKAADVMGKPADVAAANTEYEKEVIEGYRRELLIADLFSSAPIQESAIQFYRESSTVEGGPDEVAEGAKKPQMSFGDPDPVTVTLQKIASYMKETEELVEDTPWLANAINQRGMYEHALKVEDFLVSELTSTSGVQTMQDVTADNIFAAAMAVKEQTKLSADAVVINPADYQTLRLAKDKNDQYYGGGYFYAQYGQGGIVEQPSIWGLRTVVSGAVPAGTALVGAFKLGGEVLRKGGVTVDFANQNEDDFLRNLITILIEERVALAVRRPEAFVILSQN